MSDTKLTPAETNRAIAAPAGVVPDNRCPTCRQRNSRVRQHKLDNGYVLVWYCNVVGCENHPDRPDYPDVPVAEAGKGAK